MPLIMSKKQKTPLLETFLSLNGCSILFVKNSGRCDPAAILKEKLLLFTDWFQSKYVQIFIALVNRMLRH